MFSSLKQANQFRQAQQPTSVPRRKRGRNGAIDYGPMAPLHENAHNPAGITALDPNSVTQLQILGTRCNLVAGPMRTVLSNAVSGNVRVVRDGVRVVLQSGFDMWMQHRFLEVAQAIGHQILLYGMAFVLVVPSTTRRNSGLRPSQQMDASRRASGVDGKPLAELVVPDIGSSHVSVSWTTRNGVRYYQLDVDGVDESILESAVLIVDDPPSDAGAVQSTLSAAISDVLNLELLSTAVVDAAVELSDPCTLLQKRHGPSASSASVGPLTGINFFSDMESANIVSGKSMERQEQQVAAVKMLNELQTRIFRPLGTDQPDPSKRNREPRTHVIPEEVCALLLNLQPPL